MELTYAIIPGVLIALNETLKKAGMPSKFAVLVNLAGGIIGGLVIEQTVAGFVGGLIAGLSAGGAYSGVKAIK